MLWTIVFIILTFFAVLGVLECVLTVIETLSTARYRPLDVVLTVSLEDSVDNVQFLLNTLLLQANRISYRGRPARVVIVDAGMDEQTFSQVHTFCEENENITVEL